MRCAIRTAVLTLSFAAACSSPHAVPEGPPVPPPHDVQQRRDFQVPDTDENATQQFLEREIQRKGRAPEPSREPARPPVQTVLVDRYIPPPRAGDPVAGVPWGTLYGASVGALIGYGSDHSGRGAAIGAGVGFLFDLGRWSRD